MSNLQIELISSFQEERESKLPTFEQLRCIFGTFEDLYWKYIAQFPMLHKLFFSLKEFEFYFKLDLSLIQAEISFSAQQLQNFVLNYFKYQFDLDRFKDIAAEYLVDNQVEEKFVAAFVLQSILFVLGREDEAEEVFAREEMHLTAVTESCGRIVDQAQDPAIASLLDVRNQDLVEDNLLLKSKVETLLRQMDALKYEHDIEVEQRIHAFDAETRRLSQENENLLQELHNAAKLREEELNNTRKNGDQALYDFEELSRRNSSLMDENALLKIARDKAVRQVEALQADYQRISETNARCVEVLRAEIAQLEGELKDMHIKHGEASGTLARENMDLRELASANVLLKEQVDSQQAELTHIKRIHAEEAEHCQKQLERTRELEELKTSHVQSHIQSENDEIRAIMKEQQTTITELRGKAEDLEKEVEEYKEMEVEMRSSIEAAIASKDDLPAQVLRLSEQLQDDTRHISRLQAEKLELQQQLAEQIQHGFGAHHTDLPALITGINYI